VRSGHSGAAHRRRPGRQGLADHDRDTSRRWPGKVGWPESYRTGEGGEMESAAAFDGGTPVIIDGSGDVLQQGEATGK
jgi:hypothetical protein